MQQRCLMSTMLFYLNLILLLHFTFLFWICMYMVVDLVCILLCKCSIFFFSLHCPAEMIHQNLYTSAFTNPSEEEDNFFTNYNKFINFYKNYFKKHTNNLINCVSIIIKLNGNVIYITLFVFF